MTHLMERCSGSQADSATKKPIADIFAKLIQLISSGWILIWLKIWNFHHLNWVKMSQSSQHIKTVLIFLKRVCYPSYKSS